MSFSVQFVAMRYCVSDDFETRDVHMFTSIKKAGFVLNENFGELRDMMQDAMEDALLMGCDEEQFRQVMRSVVEELHNPYGKPDDQD